MEAKRDTIKVKAKLKLLPTFILSTISDILGTIGYLLALSRGQLVFRLEAIKYSMTKYIEVLIYLEKCVNCMGLHEILYQVLFGVRGVFLCGTETKRTGERKEYKVNT